MVSRLSDTGDDYTNEPDSIPVIRRGRRFGMANVLESLNEEEIHRLRSDDTIQQNPILNGSQDEENDFDDNVLDIFTSPRYRNRRNAVVDITGLSRPNNYV